MDYFMLLTAAIAIPVIAKAIGDFLKMKTTHPGKIVLRVGKGKKEIEIELQQNMNTEDIERILKTLDGVRSPEQTSMTKPAQDDDSPVP
jgi:hypothetical protein